MKVDLVVRRLSVHGGTERFVHGFAAFLLGRGCEVTVHCWGVETPLSGVTIRRFSGWPGRGRVLRGVQLERAAARVASTHHEGALMGFVRAAGFPVLRAGGGAHAAFVKTKRLAGIADKLEQARDVRALTGAGCVVFNSEMARADALTCYGLDPSRLRVIRNGVDLKRFVPARDEVVHRQVIFAGHGWSRKGLESVLSVLTALRDVRLLVVGRDPNEGRFRRLAVRLGVDDRVQWCGRVDNIERVLPQCDALVLPTRYDPSANICLEAMACGVPVITTTHDGCAEILPEPWQAVADPDDTEALAATVERVLQTPALKAASREEAERWSDFRSYVEFAETLGAGIS